MHARRTTAALGAAALLLTAAACGGSDDNSEESEPSTSIGASPSATATPSPGGTPSATPSASPSESPTATGREPDVTVQIDLVDGKPTELPEPVVEVAEGQVFRLEVTSDKAYQVHIHGYDAGMNIGAGETGVLDLVCDQTGTWEVEVEETGRKLFDLRVE